MPKSSALPPAVRKFRGKHAVLTPSPWSPETVEAARDYRAEVLAEHVRKVVGDAPPLTAEQRDRFTRSSGNLDAPRRLTRECVPRGPSIPS